MGWEYQTTDCKETGCNYMPRCQVKSKKECEHYNNIPINKRHHISFLDGIILVLKAMEESE